MNFRRLVSAVAALAVAGTMCAGLAVTASAASYAATSVDLSSFGTYDSDTGIATISHGIGKEWSKLDLTAYYTPASESETVTSVTVSYTETITAGGRVCIGFYDEDVAQYNTNSWQDAYGAAIMYGETGSSSTHRVYYNNGDSYVSGSFSLGSEETVSLTFDLTNSKVTGNIGAHTVNYAIASGINSIDTMAFYSWTTSKYQISDMTISYETTDKAQSGPIYVAYEDESENAIDTVTISKDGSGYYEDSNYTYAFTKYYESTAGDYYEYTESSYSKSITLTTDNNTVTGTYSLMDEDIVYYSEAENLSNIISSTAGTSYSGGCYTAVSSGKNASIGTLSSGKYTMTFYLAERGDRGIYLRDTTNSDNTSNIIVYANIDKNSSAGVYTVDFTLTGDTTIGITGYTTSSGSTNQSSGFDYVIIEKTAELPSITATEPASATVAAGTTLIPVDGSTSITTTAATDVYTIWAKVENSEDTTTPSVTITDADGDELGYSEHISATLVEDDTHSYNGYYCVQILADDSTAGATVKFEVSDAEAEVTLPTATE